MSTRCEIFPPCVLAEWCVYRYIILWNVVRCHELIRVQIVIVYLRGRRIDWNKALILTYIFVEISSIFRSNRIKYLMVYGDSESASLFPETQPKWIRISRLSGERFFDDFIPPPFSIPGGRKCFIGFAHPLTPIVVCVKMKSHWSERPRRGIWWPVEK